MATDKENRDRNIEASEPLAVSEGLDVVVLAADEVLVQFGTRSTPSELLRDPELRGFLGPMTSRLLEGPVSVDELAAAVPDEHEEEARRLLEELLESGFLTRADEGLLGGYLRYAFGDGAFLTERSVIVLGAGPLGARVATGLLQHGLGRLTVMDSREPDEVWDQFTPVGVRADGEECAARALGSHLEAHTRDGEAVRVCDADFDDLERLTAEVGSHDLAVVAFERPNLRLAHLVNRLCLEAEKPWLLVQIDGHVGVAGPLFLPPDTACYNCYRVLFDASLPSPTMAQRYRRHLANGGGPGFFPGLPAHGDLVAAYGTLAAAHFLARGSSFLAGRALVLDFGPMTIDLEDVYRLPRCPSCSRFGPTLEPPFEARVAEAAPGTSTSRGSRWASRSNT